jgi:MFS family permease
VPFFRMVGPQFYLALFIFFFLFSTTQLVRLATPISLSSLSGNGAEGLTGIAFTLAGVASVAGVLGIARQLPARRIRTTLIAGALLAAVAHLALAASGNVPLYIVAFALVSLVQASILPSSNTLIASSVPRHRRGTAFGLASSAQAIAFMVGPGTAAAFAAVSLRLGYAAVGAAFVAMAALLWLALREPGHRSVNEAG